MSSNTDPSSPTSAISTIVITATTTASTPNLTTSLITSIITATAPAATPIVTVTLTSTAPDPGIATDLPPFPSQTPEDSRPEVHTPTGILAGASIGGVVFLIAVGAGVWYLFQRRKRRERTRGQEGDGSVMPDVYG